VPVAICGDCIVGTTEPLNPCLLLTDFTLFHTMWLRHWKLGQVCVPQRLQAFDNGLIAWDDVLGPLSWLQSRAHLCVFVHLVPACASLAEDYRASFHETDRGLALLYS
jgi:hypothetical protein